MCVFYVDCKIETFYCMVLMSQVKVKSLLPIQRKFSFQWHMAWPSTLGSCAVLKVNSLYIQKSKWCTWQMAGCIATDFWGKYRKMWHRGMKGCWPRDIVSDTNHYFSIELFERIVNILFVILLLQFIWIGKELPIPCNSVNGMQLFLCDFNKQT